MQPPTKISHRKQFNEITKSFLYWSSLSKSKNFPAMFTLVQPNSNFYDLTQTCQKSHKTGIEYFYEFEGLEIVRLSKNKNEASIQGAIILNMSGIDIIYKGKFISTCCRENSSMDWKLNDIEIEWQ
jgi:hypothetical protein